MKGTPTIPAQRTKRTLLHAFTLVEVMVSMMILAMGMTGLTGLFLQNLRYSKWQTNNVQVTNSTFGMADQIKNLGANEIFKLYQDTTHNETFNLSVVDPADTTDGFKTITLKINQKDANVVNSAWNTATLRLGRATTSPTLAVSYWITIRRNSGDTPKRDILELTFIYRWGVGGSKAKTLSQIQLSFPAPNCEFK